MMQFVNKWKKTKGKNFRLVNMGTETNVKWNVEQKIAYIKETKRKKNLVKYIGIKISDSIFESNFQNQVKRDFLISFNILAPFLSLLFWLASSNIGHDFLELYNVLVQIQLTTSKTKYGLRQSLVFSLLSSVQCLVPRCLP